MVIGNTTASKAKVANPGWHVLLHLGLLAGALVMLLPFIWMLSTSLKQQAAALLIPPQWIPNPVSWNNYPDVLENLRFGRYFTNTVIVTIGRVAGQLITCSMAAFAFARLRFKRTRHIVCFLPRGFDGPISGLHDSRLYLDALSWMDQFLSGDDLTRSV